MPKDHSFISLNTQWNSREILFLLHFNLEALRDSYKSDTNQFPAYPSKFPRRDPRLLERYLLCVVHSHSWGSGAYLERARTTSGKFETPPSPVVCKFSRRQFSVGGGIKSAQKTSSLCGRQGRFYEVDGYKLEI